MKDLDYKRYKILLVDDELDNLSNLIFAFELSFDLVTASSAAQALDILNRQEIAVVVSDQRMPAMSGIELLTIIKEAYPKVVRMLITAYSDIEAAIAAINLGDVYRYIRKDLEISEIETIFKQAIEYYQMKEDLETATRCLIKSEKLTTIGEMAAGIGHELNNIVHGLALGIDGLADCLRAEKLADRHIDELLTGTLEYTKRLKEMVERFRDFAKPGRNVEAVDIYKVVDAAVKMARAGYKKLLINTEVVIDMDKGIPEIEGNGLYFEEVFINLISNAAQAMQGMKGRITIKGRSDGDWICVSVQDTGPGIPKESLKKVLDAFYTTKDDGMGMGLYIIDNIIKAFGGRLEVESELGAGSTFSVILPAAGLAGAGTHVNPLAGQALPVLLTARMETQ